eukprot:scaffold253407_cov28-Tisochrysis_lutea.AAC.2
MALQYWRAQGAPAGTRGRLLTVRGGYHGDTFGAMSVCDPINGMHAKLFESVLPKHLFAPLPSPRFGEACEPADLAELQSMMRAHREDIAAVILEPIVQARAAPGRPPRGDPRPAATAAPPTRTRTAHLPLGAAGRGRHALLLGRLPARGATAV